MFYFYKLIHMANHHTLEKPLNFKNSKTHTSMIWDKPSMKLLLELWILSCTPVNASIVRVLFKQGLLLKQNVPSVYIRNFQKWKHLLVLMSSYYLYNSIKADSSIVPFLGKPKNALYFTKVINQALLKLPTRYTFPHLVFKWINITQ